MLPDMKGLQGGALFVAHGTADGTYNIYSSYMTVFMTNMLNVAFTAACYCLLLKAGVSRHFEKKLVNVKT